MNGRSGLGGLVGIALLLAACAGEQGGSEAVEDGAGAASASWPATLSGVFVLPAAGGARSASLTLEPKGSSVVFDLTVWKKRPMDVAAHVTSARATLTGGVAVVSAGTDCVLRLRPVASGVALEQEGQCGTLGFDVDVDASGIYRKETGAACHDEPVAARSTAFRVGPVEIDLGESDDAAHPTAWQGPITISRDDAAPCQVDPSVSLVQLPLHFDGHRFLVSTYSGSASTVYAVDTQCRILWKSDTFAGPLHVDASGLDLAGTRVPFGEGCVPVAD